MSTRGRGAGKGAQKRRRIKEIEQKMKKIVKS